MADTPPTGPDNDVPSAPAEPQRRSLPRAARLSRLPGSGEPQVAAPPAGPPPIPPVAPAAAPPIPPVAPAAAPPVASAAAPPVAPPAVIVAPTSTAAKSGVTLPGENLPDATAPGEPISGGVRMVELVATDAPAPSPAVMAAKQAAERAAARTSAPVTFKPLQDSLATRSAIISGIGLLLCFFPALALVGFFMGLVARRRIQRSGGQLVGAGSALLGILLGAAGVVMGTTAIIVFLVRR